MRVPEPDALVFDTGPVRHFAVEGWLRALEFLADGRRILIPETVAEELERQALDLAVLNDVLRANWITIDRSDDLEYVAALARYEERLAVGRANLGECGVLALGEVRGYEVVLDDATARSVAQEKELRWTATVPLLCQAVRARKLTVSMVEKLADDLLAGEYHLPFGRGEFRRYATENGLIDYEPPVP